MNDTRHPFYEHGFWWWYDPARKDWFIGPSPAISTPAWVRKEDPLRLGPTPTTATGAKVRR
jgi:hypothetical protein